MKAADRLKLVQPSMTVAAAKKAAELKAAGRDIIDLTLGEPDYDTPPNIKEAGKRAIDLGLTKYTRIEGLIELREAIRSKFLRENNLSYGMPSVMISAGAKHAMFNAMLATLNPGDEVILLAPYWGSYVDMVLIAQGIPIIVECSEENEFKVRPEALRASITDKTRWIFINSPNNPSGAVYNAEDLRKIADVLLDFPHVWILSDDIYEHILYDGADFHNILSVEPSLKDRTLLINGVSKAYAMTGWRLGYAAGPAELIGKMSIIQSQSTSSMCSISQHAAIEALNGSQDSVRENNKKLQERRDMLIDLLSDIPGLSFKIPQGAFYFAINCKQFLSKKYTDENGVTFEINSGMDFCDYLLSNYNVAVVGGEPFGAPGYFRLSFAANDVVLKKAASRIKQACEALLQ